MRPATVSETRGLKPRHTHTPLPVRWESNLYKLFPALAEVEGVGRLHYKSIILDGEGEHG